MTHYRLPESGVTETTPAVPPVLQNTHDLASRLREFVASLGIRGTVYHEQPAASGKSWSFTVVQIDESRTVPDKRRILKVRVTEESNE